MIEIRNLQVCFVLWVGRKTRKQDTGLTKEKRGRGKSRERERREREGREKERVMLLWFGNE